MAELETVANRFADPDRAYRLLIEAHRGLDEEASAALNARLILILINQIGDTDILRAALELAKAAANERPP
ncbi:MAG: DUF2783 domain-containing protein [Hyphomicrobiaceae bacterium]